MLSRFEQFSTVISDIYRYIQNIERDEMIKYGYKGSFAQYLVVMKRYSEGITSAQLCEICGRDKAAVSRVIAEMEEKGLVMRLSENGKAYRAKLILTEEGMKAADFVCRRARTAVMAVGKELTEDDRRIFYATLNMFASNLRTLSKEGIPQ